MLHVTEKGVAALEEEYGLRSEVMSESNIDFYCAQVKFIHDQLEETKRYNQTFTQLLEMNDEEKGCSIFLKYRNCSWDGLSIGGGK